MIKSCVEYDCQLEFEITEGEQEFFASKEFELPKRCHDCRRKRKELKKANKFNN